MQPVGTLRSLDDVRHRDDWSKWEELTADAPPFLSPTFFQLTKPLAEGEPIVAEAWEDGHLIGALPLALVGRRLVGLESSHTPFFDYSGEPRALESIWSAIDADRRWDVLTLEDVPEGSVLLTRFRAIAEAHGAKVVDKPSEPHLYFDLPGFEGRLNPKFLTNLRRCARKAGGITLQRIASPTRSEFQAALAIESMGWKGAAGSSIDSRSEVAHLYDALTRVYGRRGKAYLAFLVAGGERLAELFCVEDAKTLYAMKIGYDTKHSALSPGHLMIWAVAQDAEKRGLQTFDFLGCEDGWKRKWTDARKARVTLVVYRRSARGLAQHALHEIIAPRVPDRAKWAPLRHGCQHDDLLAPYTPAERVRYRLKMGLGIRSGIRRALRKGGKVAPLVGAPSRFAPGEWVRVLDEPRLRATLDARDALRGLVFVPQQFQTCGRVFRVAKHVRRMADDDGRMRPIARTVMLEGVTCAGEGTEPAGCGRHCPLMFRDEWLEPAEAPKQAPPAIDPRRHARVRDIEEIRATLDLQGKRDGVSFMPEMVKYTKQRFVVAGRLPKVYELNRWGEPRAAIYVLEGLSCSGEAAGRKGPCDRACALLWHADWLVLE